MSYLDQLSNLAKKKSRDQSGRAVRGIIEWWRGDGGEGGGAPSRKLRAFVDQPGLSAVAASYEAFERGKGKKKADEGQLSQQEMDQALVVYAFEDWLKKWFFGVLQALEVGIWFFFGPLRLAPDTSDSLSKCHSTTCRILVNWQCCICQAYCVTSLNRRAISCACSSISW